METKFTIQELINDYRESQNAITKAEKDVYRQKYNIESNKVKEISHAIISIANEQRRNNTEYNEQDWQIWNLCFNAPASRKKLEEAFEGERIEFIYFVLNKTRQPKWRGDNRYNIIKKILTEKENSSNTELQNLISSLFKQTLSFKEQYIKSIVSYETKRFEYFEKYKNLKAWINYKSEPVISKENTETIPENFSVKWLRVFENIRAFSRNFNKEYFIKQITENAEKTYNENIHTIAEKLYKNAVKSNIKVNYISDDPKVFEIIITDGYKTAHCRSIFCAEYSTLVEPHWRFITTIRQK